MFIFHYYISIIFIFMLSFNDASSFISSINDMYNNQIDFCSITNNGYIVNSKYLSIFDKLTINYDLTIIYEDLSNNLVFYDIYKNDNDFYYLPLYYGLQKFGLPKSISFNPIVINVDFSGSLRDYQINIIDNIYHKYFSSSFGGCVLTIPPGKGKTVIGIALACKLKLKTLIIVHKSFLLDQWKERINQYSNATIGFLHRDNISPNADIVIGMLHSIVCRDYDIDFSEFGLCIFDECHHLAARVFSKIMMKNRPKFTLGLSATPTRKDKLDWIINLFIGPSYVFSSSDFHQIADVNIYNFTFSDYEKNKLLNINHSLNSTIVNQMYISGISKCFRRNIFISNIIREIFNKSKSRKFLILSGRIDQLEYIYKTLETLAIETCNIGYYIGKTKKKDRKITEMKRIILSTYEMANEGLDIPALDTLIFASPPSKNIEQAIGRIMRTTDVSPLIIDVQDTIPHQSHFNKTRLKYYKTKKYNINSYDVA